MSKGKVDFFFVGYPKSGSTTFYNLLRSHPECFAPDLKEPKFFSSDFNRELKNNLGGDYYQVINSEEQYDALFVEGAGKIKGDFNPFNILSAEAATNIFNYNPHAKIIISIREPVSFLRSFHFQSLYRMIEDEPDFLKALSLEPERRANHNIPKYCHNPLYLFYSSLVEYTDQIRRFTDLFGYQNVKIYFFDDILKDEYGIFVDILHYLGVKDSHLRPVQPDRNPSHALRFVWLRRILFTPKVRKWFYTKIPPRIFTAAGKVSQRIFKRVEEKPFVSEEEIARLKVRFKPNVEQLNRFLGETGLVKSDVAALWGY